MAPWQGRFGLLGARGGFLARKDVGRTPLSAMQSESDADYYVRVV